MPEDLNIPKINPGEDQGGKDVSEVKSGESILLPQKDPKVDGPDGNFKPTENYQSRKQETVKNSPLEPGENPKGKKRRKILLIAGSILLLLMVVLLIQGYLVYVKAKKLMDSARDLKSVAESQDIPEIKNGIVDTRKNLDGLGSSLNMFFWIKPIPFVGNYVKDATSVIKAGSLSLDAAEIAIETTEPYLDILGFGNGNEQQEDGAKTTQERIDFVAKAIPDLLPKIDEISQKAGQARQFLDKIDPEKYPVKLGKREIREPLSKLLETSEVVFDFVVKSKPLLEVAPYLLGLDGKREYLIIFQNDTELRPTGGFLTGYAVMDVEKAKFDSVLSNDIYNLDARYKPNVKVPEPIGKYIKEPYGTSKVLRLRDMNWSPDFATSMELFLEEAEKASLQEVDGVIAVDTQTLVNFLDVIGPIGVPGYGNFSTEIIPECNCPQVIYELERYADVEGPIVWFDGKIVYQPANADNRKKIIGPLMNSVLANSLGQPKEKLPSLFEAAFKSLMEKNVLFYLLDEKVQSGVESFGIAGKIEDFDGDYLHINDANLGGRKSNLFVTQEVEQKYEVEKGEIIKTVTVTYKNPEKQDGWLNTVLPNWVRLYVPKGSQLISVEGLEDREDPYEELGKTVFAGFFQLRPEGVSKVVFKYKLPFASQREIDLLIQKQPGTKNPLYSIDSSKTSDEFFLRTDKKVKVKL